jgi:hypothetical protein
MSSGTLHIEITGDADSGKTIVANVIHDALDKAGFKTVTQIDDGGETVNRINEFPSVLDAVRTSRPDLFETPITISETRWGGDDNGEGDDRLDQLETATGENL